MTSDHSLLLYFQYLLCCHDFKYVFLSSLIQYHPSQACTYPIQDAQRHVYWKRINILLLCCFLNSSEIKKKKIVRYIKLCNSVSPQYYLFNKDIQAHNGMAHSIQVTKSQCTEKAFGGWHRESNTHVHHSAQKFFK